MLFDDNTLQTLLSGIGVELNMGLLLFHLGQAVMSFRQIEVCNFPFNFLEHKNDAKISANFLVREIIFFPTN